MEAPAEEAPADDASGCVNDDTIGDSFDDTCTDYYDTNPDECGNYDTEEFVAADLCCACQGAAQTSEPADEEVVEDAPAEEAPVEEAPAEEAPAEEAPALEGCVNDDTIGDSFDDTCTDYYDANPDECGNYDTEEFVAADLCCACMGGAQVTEPTDVVSADVAVDEGPETSAECVDDDSVVDSYGDSCTDWYNFRPETCGDYDTDEFIAA